MGTQKTDILILSHRYEITSGGEKALLDMIKYLVSVGIKPHVIIGDSGNIIGHLNNLKVPYSIIYLPFWAHDGNDPTPFTFTSLNPTVNTTLQIVNLIKKLKPKLCLTNTMVMPWLGYAASITQTPHAWMIHELGTAGFNFHYAIGEEQTLRTIDNLSDNIFYNSRYTAAYYASHFTFNKNTPILYPAGDSPKPEKISSPFKTSGIKIVCVGQIKQQKGQLDIVSALGILKNKGIDAELLLIGDTEEENYLDSITHHIQKNNLAEHVRILGYQSNPASYVNHADIAINCAINESFGRVTVEAMLLKKPVIGAESAGTAEILDSIKHGLLYTPGDSAQLAEKIIQLYENPKLMNEIGLAAYLIANERYSASTRYLPFISYYNNIPKKTALDLSLLDSVIADFQSTIDIVHHYQQEKQRSLLRKSASYIKRKIIR